MKETFKGSCLCGAVTYAVTAQPRQFYFCHCAQCRKITGSAFAANIVAEPAALDWLTGTDRVVRFDYPDERAFAKVFCSTCGAGLPFVNASGDTLYIPAGSLDQAPAIKPGQHIFWHNRATWFEYGASMTRCSGSPNG